MVACLVEVRGAVKNFGSFAALRGLNLDIEEGETYGLLGPNGSGKTTLIRAMAGVLRLDGGEIRIFGKKVPSREVAARVGYMTQAPALYEDLTVRENITFFARLYGLREKVAERMEEVMELVYLADKADRPVRTLSGGMKQRTNLACALVHRPRLVLLDEPTVGVDPRLRQGLWEYFHRLNREGTTLLISTHVMDEAERCGRIAFLQEGTVLAVGTPAELKEAAGAATIEEAFLYFDRRRGGGDDG